MSEMVEQVAEAVIARNNRLSWTEAYEIAKAAIQAMRHPTEAMVKAGDSCVAATVWHDMIDEALK